MTAAAMPNPIGAKEAKTIQAVTLTVATGTDTLSILLVRTASIYTNRKPVGSYPRRPLALAADDDHERDEDADHHYGERDEGIASVGDQQSEQAVPHVRSYAGPYQGGAVPPVRISLRLFSSRSRNGRWMAK